MSLCEKCQEDAYIKERMSRTTAHPFSLPQKTQTDHYFDLLEERKDNPCSPEQQEQGNE